jgi:hypothetical protein
MNVTDYAIKVFKVGTLKKLLSGMKTFSFVS